MVGKSMTASMGQRVSNSHFQHRALTTMKYACINNTKTPHKNEEHAHALHQSPWPPPDNNVSQGSWYIPKSWLDLLHKDHVKGDQTWDKNALMLHLQPKILQRFQYWDESKKYELGRVKMSHDNSKMIWGRESTTHVVVPFGSGSLRESGGNHGGLGLGERRIQLKASCEY